MRGRIRCTAAVVVAVASFSLLPGTARANYCDSKFYFFGSSKVTTPAGPTATAGNPIAYSSFYCFVDNTDTVGEAPNQLLPTNNQFYIRYTNDLGASIGSLDVVVNGAGFDNQVVTLKRTALTGGATFAYDGPTLAVTGSGCIVVTQADLEEEGHIATFGATC